LQSKRNVFCVGGFFFFFGNPPPPDQTHPPNNKETNPPPPHPNYNHPPPRPPPPHNQHAPKQQKNRPTPPPPPPPPPPETPTPRPPPPHQKQQHPKQPHPPPPKKKIKNKTPPPPQNPIESLFFFFLWFDPPRRPQNLKKHTTLNTTPPPPNHKERTLSFFLGEKREVGFTNLQRGKVVSRRLLSLGRGQCSLRPATFARTHLDLKEEKDIILSTREKSRSKKLSEEKVVHQKNKEKESHLLRRGRGGCISSQRERGYIQGKEEVLLQRRYRRKKRFHSLCGGGKKGEGKERKGKGGCRLLPNILKKRKKREPFSPIQGKRLWDGLTFFKDWEGKRYSLSGKM